jgi:hypothetical protein
MKDTSEWLVAITFRPIAWVSESIVIVAQNLDTSAYTLKSPQSRQAIQVFAHYNA